KPRRGIKVRELGINNCFAAKRWPEPAAWAAITAKTFKLRSVQFSLDLMDPRADRAVQGAMCEEIRQALSAEGLRLHSTFTGLAAYAQNLLTHPQLGCRLDALDWWDRAIQLSARLGAQVTGGHLGAMSTADFQDSRRREYLLDFLIEALVQLSFRARQEGIQCLLWEPMPILREAPATIRDAVQLHERANKRAAVPIQFCLDLGHQCAVGASGEDRDPYAWLRQIGTLCPCIHLQQTDGKGDRHWPFTAECNRQGIIRPAEVLEALDKSGARDTSLMFEIIHAFEADESQVIADIAESAAYWQSHI
ncbi:MAG TPA: TIM barrel protein, partial [bacterium]|nr:TIM barrel protein [bacterium]